MKPFDLDTLLNLKDLEIAQLAHHLRPIFGLVFINVQLHQMYFHSTPYIHRPPIPEVVCCNPNHRTLTASALQFNAAVHCSVHCSVLKSKEILNRFQFTFLFHTSFQMKFKNIIYISTEIIVTRIVGHQLWSSMQCH